MSATPPPPSDPRPSVKDSSPKNKEPQDPQADDEMRRAYSRFLGWLVLAIIIGYVGLQLPLPWRLLTIAASLFGVVGGVLLFIQALRKKLGPLVAVGTAVVTLCCGFFLVTAGTQAIFWNASVAFDECTRTAVTERALTQCSIDYENDLFSQIPGIS